jgi:hypothetical protein
VTRHIVHGGLVALVVGLSACASTFDSTRLGVPVSLADAAATPPQGTAFRVTKHPVYFFWGMTGVSQPNLEDILAGQVGTGSRLTNVRIRVRSRWSDLLITLLTAGLIVPRSVTFEGIVVP